MIAWMQKHNKYLVVTIWIATIAFIGAGFVGWGAYQYGSKAGAIARVGEVTISQEKYNFTYQNLYRQVAQSMGGNFDDAKAKKLQLPKQAYRRLVMQAYLLNLAQEYGIVVSDDELARAIEQIPSFQQNGVFSKTVYMTFLDARRLKPKDFEAILRDDLVIEKLMNFLNKNAVPFEKKVIASALSVSDKIRYTVLTPDDVTLTVNDAELKKYWEQNKEHYTTPKKYKLALLPTQTGDINISENGLRTFYQKNSFNYIDASGKELDFDKVKSRVLRDYRLKKGKKKALLDYIALKKGKKSASEEKTLAVGDPLLSKALWDEVLQSNPGTIIKPKPVGDHYVTVKVLHVVEPRPMTFEEAKAAVTKAWRSQAGAEALRKKAEALTKEPGTLTKESGYMSLAHSETLPPLSAMESSQLLQKLFTSNNKVGIISINKKIVVYSIVDQKMNESDGDLIQKAGRTADRIKQGEFERSLLKELSGKYPVKSFVKGF